MAIIDSSLIYTLSKLFPDGCAIEPLRGNLLIMHGDGETTAKDQRYNGQVYVSAPLDPHLAQVLRLPAAAEDFGTIGQLIADLEAEIANHAGLDEAAALLVATFVLSTWVLDCLPGALCLNPFGTAGSEGMLLDLLACLCRRSLFLVDASVRELSRLPEGLCPTMIIREPNERNLRQFLAATTTPDVSLLRAGGLFRLQGAIVACTTEPATVCALRIPLLPTTIPYHRMSQAEAQQLAEKFQPRLLGYRLQQHLQVTNSQFDRPRFAPETRMLARVLGAAVEGSLETQTRILDALENTDEQTKVERSQTDEAVVLEALLALCHETKSRATVNEVAKLTNTIRLGRHDSGEMSAKAVGGVMRKLGLYAKRTGPGYELALDRATRVLIHLRAADYNVLSMLEPPTECALCDSGRASEFQVHDVQEGHKGHAELEVPDLDALQGGDEVSRADRGQEAGDAL